MPSRKSPHISLRWPQLLGYAVAAAFAALAILSGMSSSADSLAPFGCPRLVIVHVLSALPCAAVAAHGLCRLSPSTGRKLAALVSVAIGLMSAAATSAYLPVWGAALDAQGAGYIARLLARVALCVTLELPWCLAAELLRANFIAAPEREKLSSPGSRFYWGGLAVVAAVALPAIYGLELSRQQTARASELIERQQVVAAERIVRRLSSIGSEQKIAGATPRAVQAGLKKKIAELERRVGASESTTLSSRDRLERARALSMLNRADEAQAAIRPVAESEPDAALLLAAILQEQEKWDESTRWYQTGARLAAEQLPAAEATARRIRAIGGVAFNARGSGDYAAAEAAYLAGLLEIPSAAAHFHYQLGRHYHAGGRPTRAAEHLQTAAELAPQQFAQPVAALLKQLALETPACLLSPRQPSSGASPGPER